MQGEQNESFKEYQKNNQTLKKTREGSQFLKKATVLLVQTYMKIDPNFRWDPQTMNPRRILTQPSEGVSNGGYDNEEGEAILKVNDSLDSPENSYLIIDLLGKGVFGQVVRVVKQNANQIFAAKIIKNRPAYLNQAMVEIRILKTLNEKDQNDQFNIVKLEDYFVYKQHLVMIFELMGESLYDLLFKNNFKGISINAIQFFAKQILIGLNAVEETGIIHCDLKPENILFKRQSFTLETQKALKLLILDRPASWVVKFTNIYKVGIIGLQKLYQERNTIAKLICDLMDVSQQNFLLEFLYFLAMVSMIW